MSEMISAGAAMRLSPNGGGHQRKTGTGGQDWLRDFEEAYRDRQTEILSRGLPSGYRSTAMTPTCETAAAQTVEQQEHDPGALADRTAQRKAASRQPGYPESVTSVREGVALPPGSYGREGDKGTAFQVELRADRVASRSALMTSQPKPCLPSASALASSPSQSRVTLLTEAEGLHVVIRSSDFAPAAITALVKQLSELSERPLLRLTVNGLTEWRNIALKQVSSSREKEGQEPSAPRFDRFL